MAFKLPDLPFARTALEPVISAQTLDFHHGKHHAAYVNNLNKMIEGTDYQGAKLEEIIHDTASKPDKKGVFNNAAQVWNHTFFWNSMTPGGGGAPEGDLAEEINAAFGSYDDFRSAFKDKATGQFGSGWAWLVAADGGLKVINTANAENPLDGGGHALLTCDVWEHAYYLDYQNRRPDFVDAFLDHLVNWEFVAKQLDAKGSGKDFVGET